MGSSVKTSKPVYLMLALLFVCSGTFLHAQQEDPVRAEFDRIATEAWDAYDKEYKRDPKSPRLQELLEISQAKGKILNDYDIRKANQDNEAANLAEGR
jgi:hypothetical protein